MVKIFPKDEYKIYSALSIDEIKSRLLHLFEEDSLSNKRVYKGYINCSSFCLFKLHPYRLFGFKPVVYGELKNSGQNQTEISIKTKMEKKSFAFFSVWTILMGIVSITCIPIVIIELLNNESEIWSVLPILMFVIGYGAITLNFYSESRKTKDEIINLLNEEL